MGIPVIITRRDSTISILQLKIGEMFVVKNDFHVYMKIEHKSYNAVCIDLGNFFTNIGEDKQIRRAKVTHIEVETCLE